MSSYPPQGPSYQAGPPPPPQAPPGYQNYPGQPAYQGYQGYPSYAPGGAGAPVSTAGKRFGAYLLEALLLIVTLFIGWLIWSLVVWSKGQTPAKAVLGMRCINTTTGRAATWGTMALRELVGKLILGNITFGITTIVSAIMVLVDNERHEALWDKIASTVVVDDPEGRYLV